MNHIVYNINNLENLVSDTSYKFKVKINNEQFLIKNNIIDKKKSFEILTTITDPYEEYPPLIGDLSKLNIKEIKS
jgi:hypothetical protein